MLLPWKHRTITNSYRIALLRFKEYKKSYQGVTLVRSDFKPYQFIVTVWE